jgi:hypothetical protein
LQHRIAALMLRKHWRARQSRKNDRCCQALPHKQNLKNPHLARISAMRVLSLPLQCLLIKLSAQLGVAAECRARLNATRTATCARAAAISGKQILASSVQAESRTADPPSGTMIKAWQRRR